MILLYIASLNGQKAKFLLAIGGVDFGPCVHRNKSEQQTEARMSKECVKMVLVRPVE